MKRTRKTYKRFMSIVLTAFTLLGISQITSIFSFAANGDYFIDDGLVTCRITVINHPDVQYTFTHEPKSVEILDYRDDCLLAYASIGGFAPYNKLTSSSSKYIALGATIGAKGDVWSGSLTASMNYQDTITSEISNSGIPANYSWCLGLIGRVYLVKVKYKVTMHTTLVSNGLTSKSKQPDKEVKLLIHPVGYTSIAKIFKNAERYTIDTEIKYLGGNYKHLTLNYVKAENIGSYVPTGELKSGTPTSSYILF